MIYLGWWLARDRRGRRARGFRQLMGREGRRGLTSAMLGESNRWRGALNVRCQSLSLISHGVNHTIIGPVRLSCYCKTRNPDQSYTFKKTSESGITVRYTYLIAEKKSGRFKSSNAESESSSTRNVSSAYAHKLKGIIKGTTVAARRHRACPLCIVEFTHKVITGNTRTAFKPAFAFAQVETFRTVRAGVTPATAVAIWTLEA